MQTLSNIALVIGWVVLAVITVVIVALVWDWIGD